MKIPLSVRNAYLEQYENYEKLQREVDALILSLKSPRWHYESRVKSEEGFALKLETGRAAPDKLEDFFACTLVVENQSRIKPATDLVLSHFPLKYRRPNTDDFTHKSSESFPFDDLRLYVEYKDDPTVKPTGLNGILFEFQIKTFLQHAWSIATHDLTYKSDTISWAKARIAYQIKAMLEHAEVSIETAENLALTPDLAKSDSSTKAISEAIELCKGLWAITALPEDIVRLARNVSSLCKALNIGLDELRMIIDRETVAGRGVRTLNLSPYGIIVQSVINQSPIKVKDFLTKYSRDFKIFIPKEVELTPDLDALDKKNIVSLKK
jgi:ppGpp synthetase/RelA/SpoT-type nucleotidyltranferase